MWYGQNLVIKRMLAAGYKTTDQGHCFGLAHMAMQAFLAEDIDTFNKRFDVLSETPMNDFQNDFANLRKKREELIQQGNTVEAKKINEKIIDMQAFFDGVILYQETREHRHLFERPNRIRNQDAAETMPITLPIALDSEETMPDLINCNRGAYNKRELAQYIDLIKTQLGSNSFSLYLSCNNHGINLNYDAKKKRWLLIDPNVLPGREYADSSSLADELIDRFSFHGTVDGLVMETSIYTNNKNATSMRDQFKSMEKSKEWIELHAPSKINKKYGDISQVTYAAARWDSSWIQQNIAFIDFYGLQDSLLFACVIGSLDLVNRLIEKGVKPTQEILQLAYYHNQHELVRVLIKVVAPTEKIIQDALTADNGLAWDLTRARLKHAFTNGHDDVVNELCRDTKEIYFIQELFFQACNRDPLDLDRVKFSIELLIQNIKNFDKEYLYFTLLPAMFLYACEKNLPEAAIALMSISSRVYLEEGKISKLIKKNPATIKTFNKIFDYACQEGRADDIHALLDAKIIPTETMCKDALKGDKEETMEALIMRGRISTQEVLDIVYTKRSIAGIKALIKTAPTKQNQIDLANTLKEKGKSSKDSEFIDFIEKTDFKKMIKEHPKVNNNYVGNTVARDHSREVTVTGQSHTFKNKYHYFNGDLKGDALKAAILKEFQEQIQGATTKEALERLKREIVASEGYKVLNTAQGHFTHYASKLSSLIKTSSVRELESMFDDQKENIANLIPKSPRN